MSHTLVWFKRDLRVHDHALLHHAARRGPLLCLYIVEPSLWAQPDCARQHDHFLRESLRDLARQLGACGAPLHVAVGEAREVLARLHALQPFTELVSHEETGNGHTCARGRAVARWCRQQGLPWLQWAQDGVVRRLDEQLREWGQAQRIPCEAVDSEHFLSGRDTLATQMRGRRKWLMESFYRGMRQCWGILLDAKGQPEGGRWNLDHDNRKPWPGHPLPPDDPRPTHDHGELWAMLQNAGVRSFGNPHERQLRWPLNRQEALACLDHFIGAALPHFGPCEDAMSSQAPRLFHSLLSFALNVKMLHPLEVIQKAEAAYREGRVSLASAEGFIRQILGWREHVRGIYWAHMPGYEQVNALGHQQDLPPWFWTGQTRMRCLSTCITQSLEIAHAHHIQRLMVIGSFALLAGLQPQALHRWYLGIYIDAFEWVELPNTLGMSQGADGGTVATKPYVSSAAYIHRMSDYCRQCAYARAEKTGPNACPFNALYWDFFNRHAERLGGNHRLAPVYRQLQAMAAPQREAIRTRARHLREHLDVL